MLEGLGNLGDFLGGIGVVVTLVYLAMQIRHNTQGLDQNNELMRLSFESELRRNIIDLRLSVAGDAELADTWRRGLRGLDQLDATEAARFELVMGNLFGIMRAQFDASTRGLYSLVQTPWLRVIASSPGFREQWDRVRGDIEAQGVAFSEDNREFWQYIESFQRGEG